MKKIGFTLAEVLITLAIIGFIASITLPSLTSGVGDRQTIVAFKKSFNTLTNVSQMAQAVDGVDFASITSTAKFRDAILARSNAERTLVESPVTNGSSSSDVPSGTNRAIMFRDGTSLIFPLGSLSMNARIINEEDNTVNGFGAIIDVNGTKGPNKISYCGTGTSINDVEDCETLRSINDQFSIKIRGSLIVPNNDAAAWALRQ